MRRAEVRPRGSREFARTRNPVSARLTAASGAERVDHVLGPDPSVELLRGHEPKPERRIVQRQVLAIRHAALIRVLDAGLEGQVGG